jgi:flagellar motor switch protein FliM
MSDTDMSGMEEGGGGGGDDALAWEAMLGGEGDKMLSQKEIDRLLQFDDVAGAAPRSVIDQIVNSSFVNYDRLPMLDVIFDRLVRLLSSSFRNMTTGNVEVTAEAPDSVRFGDFLSGVPLPSLITVVRAEEWDSTLLLTVDSELIYSIVDILLGGRRSEPAPIDGRPYTVIERALAERAIKMALRDLSAAFAPLTVVQFAPERIETNPQFATITRANNAAVAVTFRIMLDGRSGGMSLLIPYASLEPVRNVLLQQFMGEKFGRDAMWETHLKSELRRTNVDLSAVLGQATVNLADILNWKPGTQLKLDARPETRATLTCGHVQMFAGEMGQRNGRIAIRIETDLGGQDEVIHGLLKR